MRRPAVRRTNRGAPARPPSRRSRTRRVLRALSVVLLVAGTLLVTDAVLTVVWQEPVSAFLTKRTQNQLADDFDRLRTRPPTAAERDALTRLTDDRRRIAYLARSLERRTADGEAVGRIRIPRIDASFVVVKGTSPGDLRKGPGLYDDMPFPGSGRTSAIAGHRTTYLAPFRHIDELERGDRVVVTMPYATLRYAVEGRRIVSPSDLGVLKSVGRERLVLSACHPLFSATQRIVVFARLVDERPGASIPNFVGPPSRGFGRPATGIKARPPGGR